jgi:hypothetical protein
MSFSIEDRQHLIAALEESDTSSRLERVDRIEWLSLHQNNPSVLAGRAETLQLLKEARESFVDGHYVATLLLALAFIEHTLIEELQLLKLINCDTPINKAISIAEEKKVFPADWLGRANVLRLRRNSFVHLKKEEHLHTLGKRIRIEKKHPSNILETDGKDAIDLMYNFLVVTLREAS